MVRFDVASGNKTIVHDDLKGPGGGVDGAGRTYYFAQADGDRNNLAALDLASGTVRVLAEASPGSYFGTPRPARDGRHVAATVWRLGHAEIAVVAADTGKVVAELTPPGQLALDPAWLDEGRLLFTGDRGGEPQSFLYELATARTTAVTRAPYLAMGAQAVGQGKVRFLNREGWGWSIDEVALPDLLTHAPANPARHDGWQLASHKAQDEKAPDPSAEAPARGELRRRPRLSRFTSRRGKPAPRG